MPTKVSKQAPKEATGKVKEAKDAPKVKGYEVPKGEEDAIHVLIEKPIFNQFTGEQLSKPFVHKVNSKQEWKRDRVFLATHGYVLREVLHCPDGFDPSLGDPDSGK